ncbi:MAG TPA: hypothetical protein VF134_06770 [Candidatus Dormibacteraeota bacterium]
MDRALRSVAVVALAQLAACGALLAFAQIPAGLVSLGPMAGVPVEIPAWILVLVVALLVASWSYLLAGALHAHPVVRIGAAVFFVAMQVIAIQLSGPTLATTLATMVGALPVLGLTAYTVVQDRGARNEHTHYHRLRVGTFAILLAAVGLSYLLPGVTALLTGNAEAIVPALVLEFTTLAILLTFVLVLAGVDFADMGESAGERLGVFARRIGGPKGLAAVTAVAALAILAGALVRAGWRMPEQLVVGVLLAATLYGLARLAVRGGGPTRVPYLVLLVASAVMFVLQTIASEVALAQPEPAAEAAPAGGFATYVQSQPPVFSLRVPAGWKQASSRAPNGVEEVAFSDLESGNPALFYVISAPSALAGTPRAATDAWIAAGCPRCSAMLSPRPAAGGWQVFGISIDLGNGGARLPGTAWFRIESGTSWLLYGLSPDYALPRNGPAFAAMVASWSPTTTPQPLPGAAPGASHISRSLVAAGWLGVAWFALAAVAAGILALLRRRSGRPGIWPVLALYVAVTGALNFAFVLNDIAGLAGQDPAKVAHLGLGGLQGSVAIGTLLYIGWLLFRRRPAGAMPVLALLLTLNVGLQVVAWVVDIYSATQAVTFSLAQGVLLVVAIAWDVTLSGSSTTNAHGRWFPRHARVLLFFGYELLTATCIVFYSSLRSTEKVPELFVSDLWPQSGAALLGAPLLLTAFVLRAGRHQKSSPATPEGRGT